MVLGWRRFSLVVGTTSANYSEQAKTQPNRPRGCSVLSLYHCTTGVFHTRFHTQRYSTKVQSLDRYSPFKTEG
ncbi:hypothetical protein DFH94DRAFT_783136 [Russula ochroleuca]|uniref:Uncharacterized protein n=1 Tax=Russula ochroleuca TaxID=152965 RepID=A0A9P5JUQ9_9AGAM|nr:hypothetical protein DFH94DRAFT_783136 [Russula ochroleuca]